jgi:hypothetical protein
MMNHYFQRMPMLITAVLLISACVQPTQGNNAPATEPTPAAATSDAVRIYFVEPADGAEVASPLKVVFGADNFIVEPASEGSKAGHGHLHVMVDTECIAAGQGIPKDETHLHYGKAQMEAELELAAGQHTLCLQAADGNHIALDGEGMTQMLTVQVK